MSKLARKNFGESWWAKRWISVLDSFGWSSRLQRGRTYARGGKVLDIDIKSGKVAARVRGSRPTPYKVNIEVKQLSDVEWDMVIEALSGQAVFAAMLLAGEMPQQIESAFDGVRLSLLPKSSADILTNCNCPDWANPCKHIAAVYYLLGGEFDSDPFLIFELRGRTKEQIIEGIRAKRASHAAAKADLPDSSENLQEVETDETEQKCLGEYSEKCPEVCPNESICKVPDKVENFWQVGPNFKSVKINISPPPVNALMLKTMGIPVMGQSSDDFQRFMEEVYRKATAFAMQTAYLEPENIDND